MSRVSSSFRKGSDDFFFNGANVNDPSCLEYVIVIVREYTAASLLARVTHSSSIRDIEPNMSFFEWTTKRLGGKVIYTSTYHHKCHLELHSLRRDNRYSHTNDHVALRARLRSKSAFRYVFSYNHAKIEKWTVTISRIAGWFLIVHPFKGRMPRIPCVLPSRFDS